MKRAQAGTRKPRRIHPVNCQATGILAIQRAGIRTVVIQTAAISPNIMTAIERATTALEVTADTYTEQRRSAQSSTRLFARCVDTNRESGRKGGRVATPNSETFRELEFSRAGHLIFPAPNSRRLNLFE